MAMRSAKTTIFVVVGENDHEASHVICAFTTMRAAELFSAQCREHDRKQPDCPNVGDPDEVWDRWTKKDKSWRRRHPAGEQRISEWYGITRINLKEFQ